MAVAVVLAVAYLGLMVLLLVLRVDVRALVGPFSLLPAPALALALALAGVVAGFLTDYLYPTPRPRTR
ncbi:hypothetical protein [Arthrobacter sp. B6]|uniref:hypothetical protein n=1 Tax=Arthrobacter sp. B6 TaxID=1570137 RepID=UPI00082A04F1|nr:hypothetical protein [Arthrobacter sp. B6]